ncbi:hypothetical protein AVEN_271202-1, partial [Araneus ventricosus]
PDCKLRAMVRVSAEKLHCEMFKISVAEVFKDIIVKQKPGLSVVSCGRHRLVNAGAKRRASTYVKDHDNSAVNFSSFLSRIVYKEV